MAGGLSRTLHGMSADKVTVKANVAVLGLEKGDGPVTVAASPQVLGAIDNGYLTRVDAEEAEAPQNDAESSADDTETEQPAEAEQPAAVTGSGERKASRRTRG